ncbi:MAG TPA: HupE/UreJ family protein [Candidatus Dormibacteraeota bacterium]|nr:HupE/UreJ family protein [Candidatus Dormibacteraeota bacterium]
MAALAPSPAAAHLNATGLGPIYDGAAHLLTSPDDLLAVLALSLWAGLRGAGHGRRVLFTLPGAWLLGSLVGMTTAGAVGGNVVSALWLIALGALLAADLTLSPHVSIALAALLGVQRGYLNGAGMEASPSAVVAVLGLGSTVFVLVAFAAAFVVRLRAAWARVAVRVIGSWVAASGLLLLGWSMRVHS